MSEENITTFFMDPDNPPPLTAEQIEMLERLDALPDDEIDLSDAPEVDFKIPPPKETASLRLDGDILTWLAESRHGADWKANSVLRHEMLREKGWAEVARREREEAARAAQTARDEAQTPAPAQV